MAAIKTSSISTPKVLLHHSRTLPDGDMKQQSTYFEAAKKDIMLMFNNVKDDQHNTVSI